MIRGLRWRRPAPDPDRPLSTLTRTAGRFFGPASPWNTPLDAPRTLSDHHWLQSGIEDVGLSVGVRVAYSGPHDPILVVEGTLLRVPADLAPGDATVVVDLESRAVVSGTNWQRTPTGWTHEDHQALGLDDPDGWGSLAAGLVLEREILRGEIPHTLALESPDPDLYGRTVYISETGRSHRRAGQDVIVRALRTYGGVVVGLCDGPMLLVRCEVSGSANPRDVGPIYRGVGIGGTQWPLHIPMEWLEVAA